MANRLVRVLHVDDAEEEFILTRELLSTTQGMDFEFRWASDVQTALEMIHNKGFDVCLVDYYMGIDRGLDFIRAAIDGGITTPFILMSGQQNRAIEREAVTLGVRQCLDKNEITTSNLLKAIQDSLQA